MKTLVEQFKAARRAATPLLAVETPDPAATIVTLVTALNGKNPPVLQWDIVRGLTPLNDAGKKQIAAFGLQPDSIQAQTINPVETLTLLTRLSPDCVVFIHNAHRFVENEGVAQGIWNLRDVFKGKTNALVLLAPTIALPAELERDVIVLDEPLPDDVQLSAIAESVHETVRASSTTLKPLAAAAKAQIVSAARGLSAFSAEQALYMAATKDGINAAEVWERKRKMIEQTKGLRVYQGGETFDDIGGLARIKEFASRLFKGTKPPTAIIWIDEIEKAMAGAGSVGDTSGTSQDQLGQILTEMQNNEWSGMILPGPPGCAKSLFAKALGASFGVPTIALDLGAMKGSLVGQSEQRVRAAMKIIKAVAGKGAYWIATCNALDSLKPELKRRFTDGIWYCDLPDAKEREAIWGIQSKAYGIDAQDRPDDTDWTGADIRSVCSIAYRLKTTLLDAATYITPVSKSDPASIEKLRALANGRFLSASYSGVYRRDASAQDAPTGGRKVEL